jgi:catechol 2,3-dioxygenase-like lactoylglutathione lyase family enzyme
VSPTAFSHVGICVSDLERSRRFYCEGLGFEEVGSHHVGDEFASLMEVPGVDVDSVMLARDGVTVELLRFRAPGHLGEPVRRSMNRLGLTHFSFRVDDVDAAAAAIERAGGVVVAGTRTRLDLPGAALDFLYCTDPDGTRIELMHLPAPAVGTA